MPSVCGDAKSPAAFPYYRWVIAVLLFLLVFVSRVSRTLLSIAIGQIADEFGYTNSQKGQALGAFFIGDVLPQIAAGWIARQHGGWLVLGVSAAVGSAGVLVTPICARAGFGALVFARLITGLGNAVIYSVTHALVAQWVPRDEASAFVGFICKFVYACRRAQCFLPHLPSLPPPLRFCPCPRPRVWWLPRDCRHPRVSRLHHLNVVGSACGRGRCGSYGGCCCRGVVAGRLLHLGRHLRHRDGALGGAGRVVAGAGALGERATQLARPLVSVSAPAMGGERAQVRYVALSQPPT